MLLLLLSCLLPATNGKNCLQCWQELPALIDYDLQILWGTPGPPAELSQSLHSLFMNNHSSPENSYLGQDHLEEAAGTLFTHIDKAIKKLRDDKPSLLEEVRVLKQQFSKELEDISEGLKDKGERWGWPLLITQPVTSQRPACNESCDIRSTLEVISCTTCQKHFLTCQDPALCPAWTGKNFRWAMGIGIALPLVTLAGDVTFSGSRRRKRRRTRRHKRKPSLGTLDHRGLQLHTAFLSPFLLQHLSPLKREKWKGCHSHQQLKPPLMVSSFQHGNSMNLSPLISFCSSIPPSP
nr:uncharacterized protein TEX51 isoform X5 [Odocoileus virginianus texanus]